MVEEVHDVAGNSFSSGVLPCSSLELMAVLHLNLLSAAITKVPRAKLSKQKIAPLDPWGSRTLEKKWVLGLTLYLSILHSLGCVLIK